MRYVFAFIWVLGIPFLGNSQVLDPDPVSPCGHVRKHLSGRKVIPYPHLREADVMWARRVWRRIDLRKKLNQSMYFPLEPNQCRMSLYDYLMQGIFETGEITPYHPGPPTAPDDMFTRPLGREQVAKLLVDETLVPIYNEWGEEEGYNTVFDTIRSDQVRFYEIKEEWFFDRQRSVLEVRIIGIKPVAEVEGPDGNPTLRDLFWVYFPEARHMFVHNEVFNRHNTSRRMTYDELFLKRRFESTIIKVSNTHDRMIADYKTGIDALLEAEKEEELIFNFEHDLWEY